CCGPLRTSIVTGRSRSSASSTSRQPSRHASSCVKVRSTRSRSSASTEAVGAAGSSDVVVLAPSWHELRVAMAHQRSPAPPAPLDHHLLARASGVLLAQAAGDALGVPYEFAQPPGPGRRDEVAVMRGGGLGPYEPGEWSDDTQMSVCVARVTAAHDVLSDVPDAFGATPLDVVGAGFEAWRTGGASDVGTQTAAVLRDAAGRRGPAATRLREASAALHAATGRTAGNGALMRTG